MKKDVIKNLKKVKGKIKPWQLVAAGMVLFALFNGSMFNVIHNKIEKRKLEKRNALLDKEYTALQEELSKLEKGDPKFLEHLARTKYHLSRPEEVEFRFHTQPK